MRDLVEIIETIQKAVPDDFENREAFLKSLESTRTSAMYSAPENITMWWMELAQNLEDFLGEPTPDKPFSMKVSAYVRNEVETID